MRGAGVGCCEGAFRRAGRLAVTLAGSRSGRPSRSAVLVPEVRTIARATGAEQYNILQNNGRMAHQLVDHVHVHVIPKPNETEGLGIGWPQQNPGKDRLQQLLDETDINTLTPVEALMKLNEMKGIVKQYRK